MLLSEDVVRQIEAGFSYQEIETNLISKGFEKNLIKKEYDEAIKIFGPSNEAAGGSKVTIWTVLSIIATIIAVIRIIYRLTQ